MKQTKSCERVLMLLSVQGVEVGRLVRRAERMAKRRQSSVLGMRHLLMASGVPWRTDTGDVEETRGGRPALDGHRVSE